MEINYSDFDFKPFNEMTPEDYAKVGFKSGLEVHQQLLTEKKLFCRCPAGHYSEKYNAEILRHMRPTLSELGEYDGTALMEFKTKKEIIYRINYDTVCTYEMDDTPPFMMNEQALDIAIEIAMLYNSHIVDEVHIARKQYLDGSIPTGFQRTAIVSVGGSLPYKNKRINLIQMSIEEDSCREYSDVGHKRIYITDRLGMPLIETVTEPEMRTPQEVADVNRIISKIVRSTGKVRVGIGAARQDVNVSVTGGTRIEIKGVPRIDLIPLLTYNEAMRQWNLLKLREELHRRGITEQSFEAKYDDVTKLMRKSRYHPINEAVANGLKVKCVVLRGFKGILRWQTQTDTYFSREFSDRVRVIACLTKLPNIVHSDSMSESMPSSEWSAIRKFVGANENDTMVLVWGDDADSETGAKEIIIRAKEATVGIPSETRQALADGTTGFERILPGPERMYPDTDLPPIVITQERYDRIKKNMTQPIWDKLEYYNKLGIEPHIADQLAISRYSTLFQTLVQNLEIEPKFAAYVLIEFPKRLKKLNLNFDLLAGTDLIEIFRYYKEGKLIKEGLFETIKASLANGKFVEELIPDFCSESELKVRIKEAKSQLESMKLLNPEASKKILMGLLMKNLRGRISGKTLYEIINNQTK
ncbi:MAG: Glu-tRNA(Gln) amidotransferase subunit GatE [Candidatus Kapaibacteriota bacterium]